MLPRDVLAGLDVRARARRGAREVGVCLAAVLLVGTAAAQTLPAPSDADRLPVVEAAAAAPAVPGQSAAPAPLVLAGEPAAPLADRTLPAPPAVPSAAALPSAAPAAGRVARWLPTGTGMWLHDWRRSEQGHAHEVVARAERTGLTHLYAQTGSSRKGWIGQEVLSQLLPATRGTDLKVIAWDFPKLDEPEKDARRLARAAFWHRDGVPMVAAVAPDVETAAEGAKATPERVRRYYAALRKALPRRTAILATVPWPSEKRTGSYPYASTAPYADAFVPMAYWYNRSPTTVTATSMTWLARFGKPVMPVGQGYDGRLDAPYLKADPSPGKSVAAFSFAARSRGAQSISLWSWQTTGSQQWRVLAEAARFFAPKPVEVPATTVPAMTGPAMTVKARPVPAPSPSPAAADVGPADAAPGRKPHRDEQHEGRPASADSAAD